MPPVVVALPFVVVTLLLVVALLLVAAFLVAAFLVAAFVVAAFLVVPFLVVAFLLMTMTVPVVVPLPLILMFAIFGTTASGGGCFFSGAGGIFCGRPAFLGIVSVLPEGRERE